MAIIREIELHWEQQPQEQVRPSEWALSRGIGSLLLPSIGLRDLIDGAEWEVWGTPPAVTSGQHGICLDTTAAYGGLLLRPRVNLSGAAQTHVMLVQTTGIAGQYAGLLSSSSIGGDNASLSIQANASSVWSTWLGNADSAWSGVSTQYGPTLLIVTGDASGTKTYLGGTLIHSTASAPAAQVNSRIVLFGERSALASYATAGRLWLYAGLQQRLSDAEVADLNGNLWQRLLDPIVFSTWADAAPISVPNITFVGAENITATSADYRATLDYA